jgi:hypothetical protein
VLQQIPYPTITAPSKATKMKGMFKEWKLDAVIHILRGKLRQQPPVQQNPTEHIAY